MGWLSWPLWRKIKLYEVFVIVNINRHRKKLRGFPGGSESKEFTCSAGDPCSIPGLGRSPGGGHGNPLQYSCLESPHWQRSLAGYSPKGGKESDRTEWLRTHAKKLKWLCHLFKAKKLGDGRVMVPIQVDHLSYRPLPILFSVFSLLSLYIFVSFFCFYYLTFFFRFFSLCLYTFPLVMSEVPSWWVFLSQITVSNFKKLLPLYAVMALVSVTIWRTVYFYF